MATQLTQHGCPAQGHMYACPKGPLKLCCPEETVRGEWQLVFYSEIRIRAGYFGTGVRSRVHSEAVWPLGTGFLLSGFQK